MEEEDQSDDDRPSMKDASGGHLHRRWHPATFDLNRRVILGSKSPLSPSSSFPASAKKKKTQQQKRNQFSFPRLIQTVWAASVTIIQLKEDSLAPSSSGQQSKAAIDGRCCNNNNNNNNNSSNSSKKKKKKHPRLHHSDVQPSP